MELLRFMVFSICLLFSLSQTSSAADTITASQSLSDGKSLVSSPGGIFELGFFSPGISESRYLGIWYKNIPVQTVVWVANRQSPINGSTGSLTINTTGHLVLLENNQTVIWSANSSKQANSQSPVLQLLDNGNLVLRDERDANSGIYLWQSFDYPSDTLLPGMKLGWDLKTGLNRRVTAWKSPDDPSPGDFIWEMVLHNYPEPVMWKGSNEFLRSGPWNGVLFSGRPPKALPALNFTFVSNEDEVYMIFQMVNESLLGRMLMNQTTSFRQQWIWSQVDQNWTLYGSFPRDPCDSYGHCGGNGNCVLGSSPICQCLERFVPASLEKWKLSDFSQGCVRRKPLSCKNDGFAKYFGLKLPDTTHSWINKSMNLDECRAKCLSNCSCSAYTHLDVRGGGSGCAIWFGDLVDIKQIPGGDQDMYIRISASELEKNDGKVKIAVIVAAVVVVVFSGLLLVGCYIRRSRKKFEEIRQRDQDNEGARNGELELPLFELTTLVSATDNFSSNNKLGEGGFGPVYKGKLADGQEIAVKRLSRSSGQGLNEFMNEVIVIAKLQHRNLVKLLGCCVEEEEKMLIYEYLPNGSLDSFIFVLHSDLPVPDQPSGELLLDWPKRFNIICGIARGLLYLHQDSRLRIIHRDLKASNVLLDNEMNPKISDFGLARTLTGGDQTGGNTNRVVGTYGYMAPEYVIDGLFSVRSDVFSFGVLGLELISGRKNKEFYHPTSPNLIGHAWRLWNEGRHSELMDTCLGSSCVLSEVLRCIHVSLLCVQHHPEDRPSMASVVIMLGTEIALAPPKQPGFFMERESHEGGPCSGNELSITVLDPR